MNLDINEINKEVPTGNAFKFVWTVADTLRRRRRFGADMIAAI
jgi:hypothetical protein